MIARLVHGVSKQSSRISARGILESKFLELKQKFQQGEVPLPSFWGGFRVSLEQIEFWQGGEHRLHDRFLYQRENDAWKIDRLAPEKMQKSCFNRWYS
ncbi:pyridoxamine 5'-phosphate oxidase [Escherichia coli]|nr:pyridoxamine 5'-phosphate oxidase [Escherichia coli]